MENGLELKYEVLVVKEIEGHSKHMIQPQTLNL